MTSLIRSRGIRWSASLSTLAAATLVLGGCAIAAGVGATESASPHAKVSATCVPPIPKSTFVPVPVSSDSMVAYNTAVSSAAVDDAMANARALSEYQQCLSRSDTL